MTGSTSDKAQEDLARQLAAARSVNPSDPAFENQLISRNVLREELGEYGPYNQSYRLDTATRDVLLAHGRQDAAAAALHGVSILKELNRLDQRISRLYVVQFVAFAVLLVAVLLR